MWFLIWGWIPVVYVLMGYITTQYVYRNDWKLEIERIKNSRYKDVNDIDWGEMRWRSLFWGTMWPMLWAVELYEKIAVANKEKRIRITEAILNADKEESP